MKKMRILAFLLILSLAAGLAAAGKADNQVAKKAKKSYDKAIEFVKAKQLDKAEEMLRESLQLEAEWAPPYALLGSIKRAQNRTDEALANFEKALTLRPELKNTALEYADTLYRQGLAAMNAKQPAKSNEFFEKLLAVPGIDALNKKLYLYTIYIAATNYSALNLPEKSVEYSRKLIGLCENQAEFADLYANGHYMLGNGLSRLQKGEESNTALLKFIDLSKSNAAAAQFVAIANFLAGINNYEALDKKVEAIKAEPLSPERAAKVDALEAQKAKTRGPNARAKLENDIIAVKNEENREKRQKIMRLAKEAVIEPYLAAAIAGQPDIEDAYMKLGNYLYLAGNYDAAIDIYKKLIEKFPSSGQLSSYKIFLDAIEREKADSQKK